MSWQLITFGYILWHRESEPFLSFSFWYVFAVSGGKRGPKVDPPLLIIYPWIDQLIARQPAWHPVGSGEPDPTPIVTWSRMHFCIVRIKTGHSTALTTVCPAWGFWMTGGRTHLAKCIGENWSCLRVKLYLLQSNPWVMLAAHDTMYHQSPHGTNRPDLSSTPWGTLIE